MAMKWRKVGSARPELGTLINAACYGGEITILQIGKTDKAAIVPLSMVAEYQELMARQPTYEDTLGAPLARADILPSEVTEIAHSRGRSAELAEAFEQPPIAPSEYEIGVDDEYEPTYEELDAMQADLLSEDTPS